jgi:hypothetical protein
MVGGVRRGVEAPSALSERCKALKMHATCTVCPGHDSWMLRASYRVEDALQHCPALLWLLVRENEQDVLVYLSPSKHNVHTSRDHSHFEIRERQDEH